jgi:hypothetical protein
MNKLIIFILLFTLPSSFLFSRGSENLGLKIMRGTPDVGGFGYSAFASASLPVIYPSITFGIFNTAACIPWIIGNAQLLWHNFNPNSTPLQKKNARSRQFLWQLAPLGVYTANYFALTANLDQYYDEFYGRQALLYRIFPIAINMMITAIQLPGEGD